MQAELHDLEAQWLSGLTAAEKQLLKALAQRLTASIPPVG